MGMILLGAAALFNWFVSSPISVSLTGWLLIGAGVLQLAYMRHHQTFWHLCSVVPDVLPGLYLVFQPRTGPGGLTAAISVALFCGAGIRFFAIFEANQRHKRWHALEAVICCILALLLYTKLPPNGLWFIGFAIALALIARGWSWVMVRFAFRTDARLATSGVYRSNQIIAAQT